MEGVVTITVTAPRHYSASEKFCLRIGLNASRYTLSEPSKAQATLLPALSESCEMGTLEQQNRFLQPIQYSDRHEERNPRLFLKANVFQASSQLLNPDREIKFLIINKSDKVFWIIINKSEFR